MFTARFLSLLSGAVGLSLSVAGAPAGSDPWCPSAVASDTPVLVMERGAAGQQRGCASCQAGDVIEDEPNCGVPDIFNGGCNGEPVRVMEIACGQTVCGMGMIQPSPLIRDTDWYSITLDQRKRLRWRVTPEFINGAHLWIMPAHCPGSFFTAGLSFSCSSGSVFEVLEAGDYFVMIAPAWTDQPTPCSNYRATVTCEDAPAGPANDSCAGALALRCNQTQTYNNTNAGSGPEDFAPLSCSLSGQRNGAASVWFKFTAGAPTANVSTCPPIAGGLIDPMLAVYRADDAGNACGSLVEIGCSDDFCQGAAEVSLSGLTIGQTYYVKVCGLADSTGTGPRTGPFNLTLTTQCGAPCPDLDGNGQTDLQDLATLLAHFGQGGAGFEDGDLDADGDVDLQDLAGLLANFGVACP